MHYSSKFSIGMSSQLFQIPFYYTVNLDLIFIAIGSGRSMPLTLGFQSGHASEMDHLQKKVAVLKEMYRGRCLEL